MFMSAMDAVCNRPDYGACAALAERVLNRTACGEANCALGAPQPPTSGTFFALTGEPIAAHALTTWLCIPLVDQAPAASSAPNAL